MADKGIIKKLNTHELVGWQDESLMDVYPITSTSAVYDENNKSLSDIISELKSGGTGSGILLTVKTKLLQVYKSSEARPTSPSGGTYSFDNDTFTAPTGWATSPEGLSEPIWMSYGSAVSTNDNIIWSIPVCIAGNVGSATVKKVYVAIIYQNSDTQPSTPTGGSYSFDSNSFTPPNGWSVNSEIAVNEETWCSIRAFYSDDTQTTWSTPSKVSQANVSLSAAQIEAVAGKINITANELNYVAQKITLNTEQLDYVAQNMTFTADQIRVIANNVDVLGTLNTRDLTINGSASQFKADGSGYLANGNITWATDGSGTLAGGNISWDKDGIMTFESGTDKKITIKAEDNNGVFDLADVVTISYASSTTTIQGISYTSDTGKIVVRAKDTSTVYITGTYNPTEITGHMVYSEILYGKTLQVSTTASCTQYFYGGYRNTWAEAGDTDSIYFSSGALKVSDVSYYTGCQIYCINSSEKTISLLSTGCSNGYHFTFFKLGSGNLKFTGSNNILDSTGIVSEVSITATNAKVTIHYYNGNWIIES